jgi:O-acetyl-ADP-ribose deacetylase (regulator of RNase III)
MHKDWQPLGFVSSWGGMEVGSGMLYPVSVVDGLVHQLGGWRLEAECEWRRLTSTSVGRNACPIGSAVLTSSGGENLRQHYDSIIHTTPPFYKHDLEPEEKLMECYTNSLNLAFSSRKPVRAAFPLLGAGARGFPPSIAIEIAASAVLKWCGSNEVNTQLFNQNDCPAIVFGLLEEKKAKELIAAIERNS